MSLKLFNTNDGSPFAPSVVGDQDGCQSSANAVDVDVAGWNDACLLGVNGEWVIRAVVDCDEAPPPLPAAGPAGRVMIAVIMLALGLGTKAGLRAG